MSDTKGKETAAITARTKPTLITIGNRQVISSGRWNNECMATFVLSCDPNRWITIGELARIAYGQNTPRSKERVRQCLNKLFRYFMQIYGKLLVTDYGGERGRATAVKIYSSSVGTLEHISMEQKLERMRKRSEITAEQYETAIELLHGKEA